jgi:hypothetical protein
LGYEWRILRIDGTEGDSGFEDSKEERMCKTLLGDNSLRRDGRELDDDELDDVLRTTLRTRSSTDANGSGSER